MRPDTLLNRFIVKAKIRHLQVLIKLTELGSMRRTAEAVHMTQPAISQMVSELEIMLEAELFFRHAKGVEPTDVTRDLLPVARRILSALEDGSEAVSSRVNQQSGVVRVSASPAAMNGIVRDVILPFNKKYPDILVHLFQNADTAPLHDTTDNSADVVCLREPSVIPKGWVFETCLEDELIAVAGITHPAACADQLELSEMGQYSWLLNRVGSVARNRFEEIADLYHWPQSARCQLITHIPDLTLFVLQSGQHLAILPRSVALPWLKEKLIIELKTRMNNELSPLGYLWRGERANPATKKFVTFLSDYAAYKTGRVEERE